MQLREYRGHTFNNALNRGLKGEQEAKQLLQKYGITAYKVDTPLWRQLDVDYIDKKEYVNTPPTDLSKCKKFEIKNDDTKHYRQCLEIYSNYEQKKLGWSIYTGADFIISIRPGLNRIYVFKGQPLVSFTKDYAKKHPEKLIKNHTKKDDGSRMYTSVFTPVPLTELYKQGLIQHIFDYKTLQPLDVLEDISKIQQFN